MAHITFNTAVLKCWIFIRPCICSCLTPTSTARWQAGRIPKKVPVLYLLHGLKGAAHTWTSYTSIERYLYESEKKMVVVMPGNA